LTRVKQSDVFDRRLTIKTMVLKRQSNRPQKKKTLQQNKNIQTLTIMQFRTVVFCSTRTTY
jgi:hypothetical protein